MYIVGGAVDQTCTPKSPQKKSDTNKTQHKSSAISPVSIVTTITFQTFHYSIPYLILLHRNADVWKEVSFFSTLFFEW